MVLYYCSNIFRLKYKRIYGVIFLVFSSASNRNTKCFIYSSNTFRFKYKGAHGAIFLALGSAEARGALNVL